MPTKNKQLNIQAKGKEADIITKAHIGLEVRDGVTYSRKEAILILCSEFLNKYFPDKKSA